MHRTTSAAAIRRIARLDGTGGSGRRGSDASEHSYGLAAAIRLRLSKRSVANEIPLLPTAVRRCHVAEPGHRFQYSMRALVPALLRRLKRFEFFFGEEFFGV